MDLTSILFLDIETVSGKASYNELNEDFQELWQLKMKSIYRKEEPPVPEEAYEDKAGIFAEFGKIVCISVGILTKDSEGNLSMRLKSYAHDDESILLKEFSDLLEKNRKLIRLCGHNIREFDIPYICRRLIINQLPLPRMLDISGKKPWELEYLMDTMLMWRFGDYKNYTKLSLLTAVFGIPTPKDDIDGSEVGRVYWQEKDLERIAIYCQKDVVAVAQLVLKFQRLDLIPEENVHYT
ncbi:MAG: ribonuclease H-like domain-containing protein [Bacteroidota bacterium]